jgi:hypothetical protein
LGDAVDISSPNTDVLAPDANNLALGKQRGKGIMGEVVFSNSISREDNCAIDEV